MEAVVMSVKKNEFEDKSNPGRMVSGYVLAVSLPGDNGWVEVWSTQPKEKGDVVTLEVCEGKFHKPKVRVV